MKTRDLADLALRNLGEAMFRNALTTLGVAVGVASLVAMLSLGVGLQQLAPKRLSQSGLFDTIFVTPKNSFRGMGRPPREVQPDKPARVLDEDARKEIEKLPNVIEVYLAVRFFTEVRFNNKPYATVVPWACRTRLKIRVHSTGCWAPFLFTYRKRSDLAGRIRKRSFREAGSPSWPGTPPPLRGASRSGLRSRPSWQRGGAVRGLFRRAEGVAVEKCWGGGNRTGGRLRRIWQCAPAYAAGKPLQRCAPRRSTTCAISSRDSAKSQQDHVSIAFRSREISFAGRSPRGRLPWRLSASTHSLFWTLPNPCARFFQFSIYCWAYSAVWHSPSRHSGSSTHWLWLFLSAIGR